MAVAPARSTAPAPKPPAPQRTPAPQASRMPVSRPGDPSEREARQLSTQIAAATHPARIALLPAAAPTQKASAGSGGTSLPPTLARAMGAAMGADLSAVRIHADAAAAARTAAMGARAVAVGGDVYFGAGQYRPDSAEGRTLIAHELVHTVQKRPVAQRSLLGDAVDWAADKAGDALAAVAAKARQFFAGRAQSLGAYRLFTMAIGHDPIADTPVSASGADVLRAIVGLVPFGDKIVAALDNHGIFDKGAAFLSRQFGALKAMVGAIAGNVRRFIAGLGLDALGRLGSLWDEAKALVTGSISEVIAFLGGFASDFAALVKEAILKPLGAWAAANVPHWNLLTGVLGRNPVSEEGDSPAQALIGAFMTLIGQEEIWRNIQKSGAIGKAWAWFQGALGGARALVTSIPGRVKGVFTGLTIADLLTIAQVFGKIVSAFASFVGDFMGWAGGTVLSLLEIILSVVAPGAVPYLKKAGGAFSAIIRNPIGFVGNLVRAGKLGFQQFAGNFLGHLKAALVGWLTGSLAGSGVYIPQGFTGRELLKFVASVLGLTWAQIRVRLVAAVGETAVKAMEAGFALVKTLVTEGPAAAWQQILAAVGNLKAMAIDAVMDFVKSRIVTAAVTKLLSMLTPAGAFIQALIAIYNTIMFFVERLSQIAQVAASFIDSISAIAGGALGAAAARVERTLAGLLVLVISFLARIAGLGKVSDAITGLIRKIRAPIEKALDTLIAWVVAQARKLGLIVKKGAQKAASAIRQWWRARLSFRGRGGKSHSLYFAGNGPSAKLTVASVPMPVVQWLAQMQPLAAAKGPPYTPAWSAANTLATGGIAARITRMNASGTAGPTPAEVDLFNAALGVLAGHLSILAELVPAPASAAAPPGQVAIPPDALQPNLIKIASRNQIAVVDSVSTGSQVAPGQSQGAPQQVQTVTVRILRPRGKSNIVAEPAPVFVTKWGSEYSRYQESPRDTYLGATPKKSSSVGQQVLARMLTQQRYDGTGNILYFRNATGKPMGPGQTPRKVPVSQCDMGHLIDAVLWWNSNGRFTYPQSPTVDAFMKDPQNYEFEPSDTNQLRGRQLAAGGARYLIPVG